MKTMFRLLFLWTALTVLSLVGTSCAINLVAPPTSDAPPFNTTSAISLQAQTRSIADAFGPPPR